MAVYGVTFNGTIEKYFAELLAVQNQMTFPERANSDGLVDWFGSALSTSLIGDTTLRIADGAVMLQGRIILFEDTTDVTIASNGYVILRCETGGDLPNFVQLRFETSDSDLVTDDMFRLALDENLVYEKAIFKITNGVVTNLLTSLSMLSTIPIVRENIEVAVSDWVDSSEVEGYGLSADILISGVTSTMLADVAFEVDYIGKLAPVQDTFDGGVRIYISELPPESIFIGSIKITTVRR